ncbi:hypothetical protein FA09DRAFT_329981 [Tilletiopsis washingtonensis]|uniref:Uncharacterized protein n=1 Tax=Tilletiopsis washingtonensis TaxID=58919 RepID=A0A316Z8C3_9BASI|nr:hypothetical protein FA09DRAFT_329981 [Tilletiopsis washingtonensis]PWN97821.1 hypothetical protein FA09DRAFT_329981 [Tilletiopsis washingtonensis]
MRFLPLLSALLLSSVGLAAAQESGSSSSASASSEGGSSSAAPSSTAGASSSSSGASSSMPTSAPSSSGGGGGGDRVCSILVGDPNVRQADCTYSSTFTPPYDQSSMASYLIGGYQAGQGEEIDAVATQFAEEVLQYYPTMTSSVSQLAPEFASAIRASIAATKPDGAAGLHVPRGLGAVAAAGAAIVAGAVFVL